MYFKIFENHNYSQPFWWVIKSANGQTLATSEMYFNRQDCLNAILSIKRNAAFAPVK
ncbi:MAG: YegP family protein [Candidatus Nomurabacteria bacterium]|jgi:uncharacterized protein YegP (UPF0339 family)|nr:YegP family protein [Candidatus Nomurabacteria bacterium]